MGVLCDYFRAADAAAVAKLMETTEGHSPLFSDGPAVADGVDAKGIDPAARDALAGVDDAPLPELAERWTGIEELMARRAQAAGDDLYCWISL